MAGSSMRNSVHRRNHKERAQPLARAKLGLLEKHGDYVKRARDYHSKRDRIKKLREKVAFRNKDEFYWGMIKQKTNNGVHVQTRGNESLPNEVVRLLKSQDAGYVRTQIAADESKINALKTHLHSLTSLIKRPTTTSDASAIDSDAEDVDQDGASQMDGIDLQRLVDVGVIPAQDAGPLRKKGKGKASGKNEVPARGHLIFADGKDELLAYERPSPQPPTTAEAGPSRLDSAGTTSNDDELGWVTPKRKGKKQAVSAEAVISEMDLARLEIEQDVEEKLVMAEAREYRQLLLAELSARLERLAALKGTLAHMTVERQMMRKSSVVVKREKEQVLAEDDHEGGQGGPGKKVEWRPQVVKWRAERRR